MESGETPIYFFTATAKEPHRNRQFVNLKRTSTEGEPELAIKEPYSIRWFGLKSVVEGVFESYKSSVLATLSSFPEGDAIAKCLFKYFSNYRSKIDSFQNANFLIS